MSRTRQEFVNALEDRLTAAMLAFYYRKAHRVRTAMVDVDRYLGTPLLVDIMFPAPRAFDRRRAFAEAVTLVQDRDAVLRKIATHGTSPGRLSASMFWRRVERAAEPALAAEDATRGRAARVKRPSGRRSRKV